MRRDITTRIAATLFFIGATVAFARPDDPKLSQAMRDIRDRFGAQLETRAKGLGIEPANLAAVLHVEASGRGFQDGRLVIRFENHIFYRLWGSKTEANKKTFGEHFRPDPAKDYKDHRFRKATSGGFLPFHGNQAREHEVLDFAKTLDEDAALQSISMGLPQVMGFNHKAIDYPSAKAMYEAFARGEDVQLDGLIAFITHDKRLVAALKSEDYETFARIYNGPHQVPFYSAKIREAAVAYRALK